MDSQIYWKFIIKKGDNINKRIVKDTKKWVEKLLMIFSNIFIINLSRLFMIFYLLINDDDGINQRYALFSFF